MSHFKFYIYKFFKFIKMFKSIPISLFLMFLSTFYFCKIYFIILNTILLKKYKIFYQYIRVITTINFGAFRFTMV